MAGELYEVLGSSRFSNHSPVPDELKGETVALSSSDGKVFRIVTEGAFLSRKIRRAIKDHGTSYTYPIPLGQRVVSKLVDYFKHHKDHPASEITGPLDTDNLADSGISRWDANFIKCEKELFFDLMLAASILDIPSLVWLTAAQAAVWVRDKSADKLRREFGMVNDMPAAEEHIVTTGMAEAFGSERNPVDDAGLWGSAIVLSGVTAAAERAGIHVACPSEAPAKSTVNVKSWRCHNWRVLIMQDWTKLATAPEESRQDRELLFATVQFSCGEALQYAADELKKDRALVLEAVSYRGETLRHAADELRRDRAFVMEAIALSGSALAGAADELRGDRSLVLEAAEQGRGSALGGALLQLRDDHEFALECIELDPQAIAHVSQELAASRDFALAAASKRGASLQYMAAKFRADREVVAKAIANDGQAAVFAHAARRNELGVNLPWDSEAKLVAAKKQQDAASASNRSSIAASSGPRHTALVQEASYGNGPTPQFMKLKLGKTVFFSAMSTPMGNMGQGNYTAANIVMEKLPAHQRPQVEAVALMWGAVGTIGMRWKAFASQDALLATPEALLSINDASRILNVTCCNTGNPENYGANFFDEMSRAHVLHEGESGKHGGWTPSDDADLSFLRKPRLRSLNARAPWRNNRKRRDPPGFEDEGEESKERDPGDYSAGSSPEDERSRRNGEIKEEEGELPGRAGSRSPRHGRTEASEAPLRGWTRLPREGQEAFDDGDPEPPLVRVEWPLVEGARVELRNLQSKNGSTGTLLKLTACGKWKVRLDSGLGVALLKDHYIRALPPSPEEDEGLQA